MAKKVAKKVTKKSAKKPAKTSALGPSIAFFDLDGTLLDGYSAAFFLARRHLGTKPDVSERLKQAFAAVRHITGRTDFTAAMAELSVGLRGVAESDMRELGQRVFDQDLLARIYPEARALVKEHQERGETVVIVSSATQFQVERIAQELGIDYVLCTRLEVHDGRLTGMLQGEACYGEGKVRQAKKFCRQHKSDLKRCTFYSDGGEDLPLLEAVGHPRPTNPDARLTQIAEERGWPVQRFQPRGWPSLLDMARTGLVYGSLLPSFLLASPLGILSGNRRAVSNAGFSLWGEFGSAAAGLDLEVSGEQYLHSHRPAVFVFNHQSAVDALVIARLLQRDFSGLAKSELKANPLLGPALQFADVVFIDRQQKGSAALQPAIEKLREGVSIAVAPEGRRSTGYRLGPFRKGAFLIAMQAGVPVIPIVIANAADALPRTAVFIRPAKVRVKVLKPISTRGWNSANLDQKIAACRTQFLKALDQWPEVAPAE